LATPARSARRLVAVAKSDNTIPSRVSSARSAHPCRALPSCSRRREARERKVGYHTINNEALLEKAVERQVGAEELRKAFDVSRGRSPG
jgi:hypothetical protein